MLKLFRHHVPLSSALLLLTDAALFFAAVLFAAMLQLQPYGRHASEFYLLAGVYAFLVTSVGAAVGLYQSDERSHFGVFAGRALLAIAAGVVATYLVIQLVPGANAERSVIPLAALASFVGLLLRRHVVTLAGRAAPVSNRVLIVGTGGEAAEVHSALMGDGAFRNEVVGFYATGAEGDTNSVQGRVFSRAANLLELVERLAINEVIVAVREQRGGVLPIRDLLECRVNGVRVLDLPGFYERVRGEVPIDSLKASWLIYGQGFAQDNFRAVVKRLFDCIASTLLFLVALPLMVVTAIAIRLESRGPVIYRQERVGRGGRPFWCFKFRSMQENAEAAGVAQWAGKNDARVTRVGRMIRKYRIDELPQLFNVLRGDMSLVGPRPERPCFVESLKGQVRFYDLRHSVKPGLTGWAQVRYSYGASVEDSTRKLQYDLYYVKNHSLFLDCVVLFETVRVVLFGEGSR